MLYLVGLGLTPKHTTQKALHVLRNCDKIYFDTYTNFYRSEWVKEWERVVGKEFFYAKRHHLENNMKDIIAEAKEKDVAIAVVGDPLVATTHNSYFIEAPKEGVKVAYVPGISILSVAPSLSGLQHYRFGPVVTIPKRWRDTPSFYERTARNKKLRAHTLLLMDIGLKIKEGIEALMYWEKELELGVIDLATVVVAIARAGWDNCVRFVGTVEEVLEKDFGEPPHSLILPTDLLPYEEDVLYSLRRYQHGEC